MADKTYYAVRQMRHPRYRTRMLQAGDVVEDVGPLAKLFEQKGFITTEAPVKVAPAPKAPAKPAAKRAPRKKAAAKKK